jgi:hypothetical protein
VGRGTAFAGGIPHGRAPDWSAPLSSIALYMLSSHSIRALRCQHAITESNHHPIVALFSEESGNQALEHAFETRADGSPTNRGDRTPRTANVDHGSSQSVVCSVANGSSIPPRENGGESTAGSIMRRFMGSVSPTNVIRRIRLPLANQVSVPAEEAEGVGVEPPPKKSRFSLFRRAPKA